MKDLSIILIIAAVLILAVQIITEIIKLIFSKTENKMYNVIVVVVALVLTAATVVAMSQIIGFALTWYIIAGAIVGAFFIAYGAMYGYDKLFKRVFETIKNAVDSTKNINYSPFNITPADIGDCTSSKEEEK